MDWVLEKVVTHAAVTVETTGAVVIPKREDRTPAVYILDVPSKVGKRRVRAWAEEKKLIPAIMPFTVKYVVSPLDSEPQSGISVFQWGQG